ncbi:sterol desaturase family protein [Novosphingobium sp. PC22D]|uniref:sterol desaturase family protein n=1 Tax=Novosphingobium sp. PC22D TaxID=1962403 RepID=UPI000BEF42AE|nr:sterol desaturase family protein [Novosphingobium sp. PC22D]
MTISTFSDWVMANYEWQLSLAAGLGILATVGLLKLLARAVPTIRAAGNTNAQVYAEKMAKPNYAKNQAWNRKWGIVFIAVIFGGILPFCLTIDPQPWWQVLLDCFVILMFYDFFYYLTHRFLFHDGGLIGGGPLMWMHAVHHRQHNPCRGDSSYIHPLEVAIGLGLYAVSIAVLAAIMGKFHVVTLVVTWVAFNQINLHNHDRWSADRFPFKYLNTMSVAHHYHHAKFTGGNFATITLLYDWLFGTLDMGNSYPALDRLNARRAALREKAKAEAADTDSASAAV